MDYRELRLGILCLTLVVLASIYGLVRALETPERMALNGYVPVRLPGDVTMYWIPRASVVTDQDLLSH